MRQDARMSFIDAEFDRISATSALSDSARLGGAPLAMWAISQLARGTFGVQRRALDHAAAWGQDSLVTEYSVALEFFANTECETVMNTELGGPLTGRIIVVNIDGKATERGVHAGSFTWGRQGNIHGILSGISNAGTHRPPLYDAVRFDQPGQFVGRLDGTFEHPMLGRCVLTASYVIDLADPRDDTTTDVKGILEGVVMTGAARAASDSDPA
jgi:hypothetical protein